MPDVRIDESVTPAAHRAGLIAALEARRVDNRFHYVGELASSRWRELAAGHSPAQDADDGVVAYDDAAKAVIAALPDGPVHVIGLACGDGVKERRLLGALRSAGRDEISATAVDVSVPLVVAADAAMAQVPGVVATEGVAVDIGVHDAGDITFRWDDAPDGPMIVGEVTPAQAVMAQVEGVTVGLSAGAPIRVLESFRHTPETLEALLVREGLEVLQVTVSPSGEEGVAVCRCAP